MTKSYNEKFINPMQHIIYWNKKKKMKFTELKKYEFMVNEKDIECSESDVHAFDSKIISSQ